MKTSFFDNSEKKVMDEFNENGYVIFDVKDKALLDTFRKEFHQRISNEANEDLSELTHFFTQIHKGITPATINDYRLKAIQELNDIPGVRETIYHLAKSELHALVGNELAMQNRVNLSIQMPEDTSSLLPIHADVWQGNSPFEVVFWLPLVDCRKTQSMFIIPMKKSQKIYKQFPEYAASSTAEFMNMVKDDIEFLDVQYGQAVIFTHSILHGNIVNEEQTTRWSFNTRFKSLLSPYSSKELGESFSPITIKPLTRLGYSYKHPEVK